MRKPIDPVIDRLNDCSGEPATTPRPHENPPGRPTLDYRVGVHAEFLRTMRGRLTAEPYAPLRALRSREAADSTLALLDAWSSAADVLSFYSERIAEEHYLRTATERRSLLELSRLVGHGLSPGVAATAYLAFDIDGSPQASEEFSIPVGTRVQSVPGPGELPQVFETIAPRVGRPEWNEIKVVATAPHPIPTGPGIIEVQGTAPVAEGDMVLAVSGATRTVLGVHATTRDAARDVTQVDLQTPAVAPVPLLRPRIRFAFRSLPAGSFLLNRRRLDRAAVDTEIHGKRWSARLFRAVVRSQRWPLRVVRAVRALPMAPSADAVYAFQHRARIFGHNAPAYASLPTPGRGSTDWDAVGYSPGEPYDLDTTYSGVTVGSYAVALVEGAVRGWARISAVSETSKACFSLSGKVTRLTLHSTDRSGTLTNLPLRSTVLLVGARPLALAPVPVDLPAQDELPLDGKFLLDDAQPIAVQGERLDLPGITSREIAFVRDVELNGEVTRVLLQTPLVNEYVPSTLRINANVAVATHGETVEEVLGSGDGQRAFPRFTLKRGPLTYVPSTTASGRVTTLEVRVNGVLWQEVETLHFSGPDDRVYVTQRSDDGKTSVVFGDGRTGARLPTGSENVRARYRVGIGKAGLVKPDQLTLMLARPLGVRTVNNPVAAADAAEPETRDQARRVVPTVALTLERVVSIEDYAAFSARYGAVAKAHASWFWEGARRAVVVSAAGQDGVEPTPELCGALARALKDAGDPHMPLTVVPFRPAYFTLSGTLELDPALERSAVLVEAEQRLRGLYSFELLHFGGSVARSELIAALAGTPGVRGVDLDTFHRLGEAETLEVRLQADAPRLASDGTLQGAELLLLDPSPLVLR